MPVHLECGASNAIAFVFSCPGRKEQEECRPAAGQTGNNLEEVLRVMRRYSYDDTEDLECNDWTRENIWITNAWRCVEYKKLTGRREASVREILCETNVARLANELGIIERVIICCGKRAETVVGRLRDQGKLQNTVRIIPLRHLGNQALNSWIPDSKLNQSSASEERRLQRLRIWAECLYNKIADEQNDP